MSFEVTKLDPSQIEDLPVLVNQLMYTKRVDFISDNLLYKGEAEVGSLSSNPVWRIRRIILDDTGDMIEAWADGNSNFDNIWDKQLPGSTVTIAEYIMKKLLTTNKYIGLKD